VCDFTLHKNQKFQSGVKKKHDDLNTTREKYQKIMYLRGMIVHSSGL